MYAVKDMNFVQTLRVARVKEISCASLAGTKRISTPASAAEPSQCGPHEDMEGKRAN